MTVPLVAHGEVKQLGYGPGRERQVAGVRGCTRGRTGRGAEGVDKVTSFGNDSLCVDGLKPSTGSVRDVATLNAMSFERRNRR